MEKFIEKVNEAFDWLNEDLIYVAMVGFVNFPDIDQSQFKKETVKEKSFNHFFEWSKMVSEDTARGEALIPLKGGVYMKFEFDS
jgi:hypothetical protein